MVNQLYADRVKPELNSWLSKQNILTWASITPEWFAKCISSAITKWRSKHQNQKIIIGVCGNAGTGKDSATEFMVEMFDNVEKIAFADPIREIGKIFGFTAEQMSDRKLKETDDEFWQTSPRKFMQLVGTEMFRKQWREDVWTKLAENRIRSSKSDLIFVTDVRFPNEAECLKRLGGYVIRIKRDGFTKTGEQLHDSEKFVNSIEVDSEFVNNAKNSSDWSFQFALSLTKMLDSQAFYY